MNQPVSQMDISCRPLIGHDGIMTQGFRCQPFIHNYEGCKLGVKTVPGHFCNLENIAEQNVAMLSVAFKTLAWVISQKQSRLLLVLANSTVLARRDGARTICRAVDKLEGACKSAVIFEAFNLPKRICVYMLGENTIPMLLFVSKSLTASHREREDYTIFANLNHVGLTHHHSNASKAAEVWKKTLTRFWSETTKASLKFLTRNIDNFGIFEQVWFYEALAMDGAAMGCFSEQLRLITAIGKWKDVAVHHA